MSAIRTHVQRKAPARASPPRSARSCSRVLVVLSVGSPRWSPASSNNHGIHNPCRSTARGVGDVSNDEPAKIYSDQRTVTIYLGDSGDGFTMPFKEKWRAPDAIAAVTRVHRHRSGSHREPHQRQRPAHPGRRCGVDGQRRCGCCPNCPRPARRWPLASAGGGDNTPPASVLFAPTLNTAHVMSSLAPLRVVGNLRFTDAAACTPTTCCPACRSSSCPRNGRTPSPPSMPSCGAPCRRARRSAA